MPWIYIVRENLSGTSYVVKQGTTTELSESATSAGEDNILDLGVLSNTLTTSQSFQKQWQNHDGGSITEDYLGLGDITITGQLWVGEKGADGKVSNMQKRPTTSLKRIGLEKASGGIKNLSLQLT